jgi:hypothetical protein
MVVSAVVTTCGVTSCSKARRPMVSPVHVEPSSAFRPVAIATLQPAATTTTTPPPTLATSAPARIETAGVPAPGNTRTAVAEPDDEPSTTTEPLLGTISADVLGAQPLAASLDDGAMVQAGRGCALLISGHRTSAGAPFRRLNELAVGEVVTATLDDGTACGFTVAAVELIDAATAFRRVNLFASQGTDAALYACADATGGQGGTSHRWWVMLVSVQR